SGKEAEEWGERASSASADSRMHELGRQRRVPEGYNQDHAYPARVYLVHGEGVEPDPHKEGAAYRAKKLRVIREVRPLSCYAEECGNAEHWPDHPHYEFLRQEQEDEDEDGGLESHFATADTWQETDEHGTYDDEHGLRHHPDKGWWCHGCQAHHDSPEEVEEHDTGHTDWDEIYPQISQQSLHRGISVHLPQHLHEAVHDQARPVAERARMLSDHLAGTNYGTSWSTNPDRADHYAYVSEAGPGATHVIMRAHMVPQSSIETDPDELADRRVIGYDKHEDQEVPLRRGAQVNVHTIEWRRAPDRDGSGREAFTSHAFPERQQHLAAGVTPLEAHFAVTDWGKSYDKIPGEIHRGLFAPESHQVFSTPASDEDIAHMLIRAHQEEHFPYDQDQHEKFGTHWTSSEDVARNFAHEHETEHAEDDQDPEHDHAAHFDAVPVVFHARRPEQHEIETDPRRLGWQNVDDHDEHEGEREVPIRHGAPVTITGVSWLKRTGLGPLWHRHDLREPVTLRAEDRDSPEDESEWNGPNPHTAAGGQYIPPPVGGQMWQHLQEAHGVNSSGKTPGDDFMGHLHDRFHAGQIADRRLVQHHHEGSGPTQADLISHFFTQAPVQKPVPVKHEPERLDDNEYTLGDVSRRYDWEGFDKHEIEHLVAKPEHATFTREDVPVHSLRAWHPDGRLRKPITYKGIARQGKDERDRLDEVERGMNEGAVPPIVVVRDGKHHIIADGSHRSAIARERGHSHIEAFVTDRTIPHGHTAAAKPEPTSFLHEYEGYGTAAEGGGFVSRSEVVHGPFYHGGRAKNLGPGDMITPGRKPNPWGDTFDHKGRSIHTYFAHEPETAVSYARETKGHLYEVKPTGKVEFDGSGGNGSWRSEHPLEVVRRIPERDWD
ncbi:MAG: hypothetical protein ACTHJ6_11170, partial [Oryzihumus sp.]